MDNYIQEGTSLTLAVDSGVESGDPCIVGNILGVAVCDRDSDGEATVMTEGVFDLSVKGVDDAGNSAVALGDHIYYTDGDTPKLNKKSSGRFFGYALETVGSSLTDTINVKKCDGPGPGTADILAGAVGTSELAAASVTKTKLAGGFLKAKVIAGGAAGDLTVTGAAVGDELVLVTRFDIEADTGTSATGNKVAAVTDLTSEFTIGANKINNTSGTNTTGDTLLVLYLDLT